MNSIKIRIEFDGWHCFSREQMNEILSKARERFSNANFFEGHGLLVESGNELKILEFCLEIIEMYKVVLRNYDGYTCTKISKRFLLDFADKKRKLSFEYFKRLVKDSELNDIKIVLAGILYSEPDIILNILMSTQAEINNNFRWMNDDELKKSYRSILMKISNKTEKL